ncbi:MAG: insulinase family protein [Bacteroidetes bacterium]|nr:MAG: insulinase family protein [Bacteroidota bacterium]
MKRNFFFILAMALFVLLGCKSQKDDLNIVYEKYTLPNGLDVILHVDRSDPIVALAIRFHVGSNREKEGHTGFAHLFEHMMFQKSENVGEDQFFKIIQDAGGTLNGGTGNDATTYFEVVPKNALEKILWLESDRMGYMISTVTENAFNIQQNVVQNEKRQYVDNQPYGFTEWVIATHLYPKGHPYSWTVIGEMEDLKNATVEDVKAFHQQWYVPNNATLVLAGDFDVAEAKKLIEKYFGEIPRGGEITDPKPMPVTLDETIKVFHEDNFAKAPQFRMIWPTVEDYNDDAYALSYLAELLSQGKKAPLYKVLEKEKKISSSQYAYNGAQEITGSFNIVVTANEGVSLKEVEAAINEAFQMFETEGFTDADVERIKAGLETDFYNRISSILGKSFQLASYNEDKGDPSYYKKDLERMKAVTKSDILRVYEKYIKGKPYLATSFVPKGQIDLVAEGSVSAGVKEESITEATQVEIADVTEEEIVKTPGSFDRSVMPADGPDPLLNLPTVWEDTLACQMRVYGIEQHELPLVQFSLVLSGGHYLDQPEKAGVAYLVSQLMMEGTKNRTPLELEEAIEMLGASINMSASNTDMTISANCLVRKYDSVLTLVKEILLEPRWDEEEFALAKTRLLNSLKRKKANPNALVGEAFSKLIYGTDHIFSIDRQGTLETVQGITIDDLKAYYERNFAPSVAYFLIAGDIQQDQVVKSLQSLSERWADKEVPFPSYPLPGALPQSKVYFVDVPGAKQSVINIGYLALARTDPDFYPATVMNYKLGGSFAGNVNMVLREEKGYTYGARTGFRGSEIPGPFTASASVRSSATGESVAIFKELMEQYRNGISEEELLFTKNALLKSNAREFETLRALIGMLSDIAEYNLPKDYVKNEEAIVRDMTLERHKELADKYIIPERMYYVIAGDAKTQLKPLEKIGFGKAEVVK